MKKTKSKHDLDIPASSYFMMFVGFSFVFMMIALMINELSK